MYEEIFNQIRSAANKRNLKDSTIHAYCTSVAHFLNHTAKDIDALTTDDVDIFLTEKIAFKQGVTEELKATDMMRWIGLMNNIRACADEIVLNDIVYS